MRSRSKNIDFPRGETSEQVVERTEGEKTYARLTGHQKSSGSFASSRQNGCFGLVILSPDEDLVDT